eukprot:71587_1
MGNCHSVRETELYSKVQHIYDDHTNEFDDDDDKSEIISNPKQIQIQCTSYSNCLSIQRILHLMQLYVTDSKLSFISEISDLTLTSILNDYHHIILSHGNDNDLEKLSHSIKCDLKFCKSSIRNVRDRGINNNAADTSIYNINEIVLIDIFDTIHCHLLHSFDTSFRLTQKEKKKIRSKTDHDQTFNFMKVTNIINIKRNKLCNMDQQRTNYNKFQTKINTYEQKEEKEEKEETFSTYSFGVDFNYWNDKNPLYIAPKHLSFKQEITSNIIYPINIIQWNETQEKAQKYIKSEYAKSLKNSIRILKGLDQNLFYYGLKQTEPISISHLMSIIFYTDFPVLSYKLSETFRNTNVRQTINDLMERNSNFCWFSKLIKETVNCFGATNQNGIWEHYFHGISTEMIFNSFIACFNHPTSTTKQLTVAYIFSGNDGIILNIIKRADFRCFNCFWISAFANEDETLFTSGQELFMSRYELIITNIINCSNLKEYKSYIHALNQLIVRVTSCSTPRDSPYMNGNNATSKDTSILDRLLDSNSSSDYIPKYFNQIFKSYQLSTKTITIRIGWIYIRSESLYFLNLLLSEDKVFV